MVFKIDIFASNCLKMFMMEVITKRHGNLKVIAVSSGRELAVSISPVFLPA